MDGRRLNFTVLAQGVFVAFEGLGIEKCTALSPDKPLVNFVLTGVFGLSLDVVLPKPVASSCFTEVADFGYDKSVLDGIFFGGPKVSIMSCFDTF